MKILITGGAGFIGSNLVKRVLKDNNQIFVIDNLISGSVDNLKEFSSNPNFHLVKEDLLKVDDDFFKQGFDLVFHLASPASPPFYVKYPLETIYINSTGTERLLKQQRQGFIKRLIYASTSEIYGDPLVHPQSENYWGNVNCRGPRACYDESKRLGETFCSVYFQKYNLDVRTVRIFNTYGPKMKLDDGRVITNFISQALRGENISIYGEGDQTRSFCYIDDLLDGLVLYAQKEGLEGEVINLGNPEEISILDLAKKILKLTGSSSKIKFFPLPKDDPQRRKPDISKVSKLLGWFPKISLEEGLLRTINFFKKKI